MKQAAGLPPLTPLASPLSIAPSVGSGQEGRLDQVEHTPEQVRRLERRRARRFPFVAELEMEWGSVVLRGRTRDLSTSGMFIESSDPLWVGAGFAARLSLDEPIRVDCSVKRIEPGRGMGVSVTLPEEESRIRYFAFLRQLSGNES